MTSAPSAPPASPAAPARGKKGGASFASAFGRGVLGLALVGGAAFLGVVAAYRADLPDARSVIAAPASQGVTLEDARGQEYAWIGAPAARVVGLNEVSPDLRRLLDALEPRLWAGSVESSVSRALAQGFAPPRPATEALDPPPIRFVRSLAAQWRYSAEERKLIILNKSAFGPEIRGFEAAAQHWFGRSTGRLTLAQAAALMGALEAPAGVDPFADSAAAAIRTARALELFFESRSVSAEEIAEARANPARPQPAAPTGPDPVFVSWVMAQAPAEAKGPGREADLRTTLDLRAQHGVDQAFETILEGAKGLDPRAEAAAVLLSRDGAVRAMAGGRRVGESGAQNRAVAMKRPIGLLFTPFAAAAATRKGGGGAATVEALMRPGATPAEVNRAALNLPYAELQKITRALGFDVPPPPGAKTAIGVRATPLQTAGAFATLVNAGVTIAPFGLTEALGPAPLGAGQAQRPSLYQRKPTPLGQRERAAPDDAARLTLRALDARRGLDALTRRAAPEGRQIIGIGAQAGGDLWFMGATADFICVVWIGRDDGAAASGADANLAADLWREIMRETYAALPIPPRPAPGASEMKSRYAAAATDWRPSMNWPHYGAGE